jgi:lipopolysaccharide export system permease protein
MRTFDVYVLHKTVRPLAISLVVALVVLLIERMLRLLDLVLGSQGPLKLMFEIMAYLVPNYIGLALPISLLIGVMVAFNTLSRDGEIDALQCAGVGLARQSRSTLFVALGVALVTGMTFGYLKPYGRYAYQAMVYTVSNAAFQTFVRAGVFSQIGDTTFHVGSISSSTGEFVKVFLYEDAGEGDATTITARDGTLVRSAESGLPALRLSDGVRLTQRSGEKAVRAGGPDAPPVGVLRFQQLQTTLSAEQSPMFRPRGVDEREFTISEIWTRDFAPPPGVRRSDMIAEFNVRLARTTSVLFIPLLGIPLALGRRRTDRTFGIAIGLLVLIVYNQILDLGKNMAETGEISSLVGVWMPFFAFAATSVWLFWRSSTHLPRGGGLTLASLPSPLAHSLERGLARIRLRRR